MKKLLILGSLLASINVFAVSGSVTVSIAASGMTNVIAPLTGGANVTQIILTSAANNVGNLKMFDSVTNILTYTNAANITTASYATNQITTWTNFFGSVNSITNVALVDYAVTNAATAYSYPNPVTLSAGTNSSVVLTDMTYVFRNGVYATNLGAAAITLTINYNR